MTPRRLVSLILHVDGSPASRTLRFPLWVVRLAVGGAIGILLLLLAGVSFYGPLARQAARVPGLEQELERLRTDNATIRDLAATLDSVESRYARLREVIGTEVAPDPLALGSDLPVAAAVMARVSSQPPRYESGPSIPSHWPLDEAGYITRGVVGAGGGGGEEPHPGLDVAVPVGSLVRAVGGGDVVQTGQDPEYGIFVLLSHPGGYTSRYGHLSAITTRQGVTINAGEVLGRSGNTGRSSAPHLHVEIRKDGAVVDPATLIRETQ